MPELTAKEWGAFMEHHPEAHILQTGAWGQLKSGLAGRRPGWQPERPLILPENRRAQPSGAQVLFRRLPLGFTLAYISRGPGRHGLGETLARGRCDLLRSACDFAEG